MKLYNVLIERKKQGVKSIAVLIDPDKAEYTNLKHLLSLCKISSVDFLFIGGSLMTSNHFEEVVSFIKSHSTIPLVIFPGSSAQISKGADAFLLLQLISGRNPDYLIGQHVMAAPALKNSGLEIIPTAYMLIESGKLTTAHYISQTLPIPRDKSDIALSTALAGELLGLKMIYLDAGSGAEYCVPNKMIAEIAKNISLPLVVGGGLNSPEKIEKAFEAGADLCVIGNALEQDPELLLSLKKSYSNA
jgi:phosphoglycerol geranylgeranyltransferase